MMTIEYFIVLPELYQHLTLFLAIALVAAVVPITFLRLRTHGRCVHDNFASSSVSRKTRSGVDNSTQQQAAPRRRWRQSPALLIAIVSLLVIFAVSIITWRIVAILPGRAMDRAASEPGTLPWTPLAINRTIDDGLLVVAAIEKFALDTGSYPQSLEELCPKYIDVIPSPSAGEGEWGYGLMPDGEFVLRFSKNRHRMDCIIYSSGAKRWTPHVFP